MLIRPLCAAALFCLASPPAAAEEAKLRCFDRAKLVAHLGAEYGETQQSVDYAEGRGLVELFANIRSGSWTMLLTPNAATSCVLRAGQGTGALPEAAI